MRLLLAVALTAIPAFAVAQTVEVETARGPATVPADPGTVATFHLPTIDTLDALGIEVDGVPNSPVPDYLTDAVANGTQIGTLHEPDFEALAVMAPDLIIAGNRSAGHVEALSEIAPTIDMTAGTPDETVLESGKRNAIAYGQIWGLEDEAEALVARLEDKVAQTREAASGKGDALILMTNGGTISAYGDQSRFGWIHSDLGLPMASSEIESGTHGEAVSFEFVSETDPDWIFVVDRASAIGREGEAAAATLDTPLVQETAAGQAGQIVYLDSAKLYLVGGGIQALSDSVDDIRAALTGGAS